MRGRECNKGKHSLNYNTPKWKKKGNFDILHYMRNVFTLVQLMDTVGNVNYAMSIVRHWTFESNYKKELPFTT